MERFSLLKEGLSQEFLRIGVGGSLEEKLQDGLVKRNILEPSEAIHQFSDCTAWHRGGAETYIADSVIEVGSTRKDRRHIIAKALVSFGSQPEVQRADWIKRRKILVGAGIRVPHLYYSDEGIILEEFIESELHAPAYETESVIKEIARIAVVLDRFGFTTFGFLDDLRIQNDKVYFVDFGSDLGDPAEVPTERARNTLELKLEEPYRSRCLSNYDRMMNKSE